MAQNNLVERIVQMVQQAFEEVKSEESDSSARRNCTEVTGDPQPSVAVAGASNDKAESRISAPSTIQDPTRNCAPGHGYRKYF
jgi:hypothetical protein